jgi:hypothetical protein
MALNLLAFYSTDEVLDIIADVLRYSLDRGNSCLLFLWLGSIWLFLRTSLHFPGWQLLGRRPPVLPLNEEGLLLFLLELIFLLLSTFFLFASVFNLL